MKKILCGAVFFLFSFGFAQSDISSGAVICSQKQIHRPHIFQKISSLSTLPHSFDVVHYALDLNLYNNFFPPFPKSFSGTNTITFRVDSALNSISLDAVNSSLTIDAVSAPALSFTHSGDVVKINFGSTYTAGETVSVKISYHHNNVTDDAFYVGNDGMVFTDAEPEGARKWFPCWDKPSDKATVEMTALVPSPVKLGSNGKLVLDSLTADPAKRLFHWISRDPVATYLVVLSAKVNYNLDIVYWHKLSNPIDSIPIMFYWNTGESVTRLNNIKTKIIPMTTYYSQLFGEHPFEKNGFATMDSMFAWGGMENQTLTSLLENGWNENLISHEFAHQWFGDMITCDTWADIWLNEGFATYCEALWYEKSFSYVEYKLDIDADAAGYFKFNPGLPIYNASWSSHTPSSGDLFNVATTYYKGACVLHMLRYVLGDSLFFSALHSYATDAQFKFGTIRTDDFVAHMTKATGQNLSGFFDQWVKRANHPLYQVYYSFNSDSSADVVIGQSNAQNGYWEMPVELKFSIFGGTDTTVRVNNAVNNESFKIKLHGIPLAMSFDPNNNIVLKNAAATHVAGIKNSEIIPFEYSLHQNYPNPFNPATTIEFSIPAKEFVLLKMYDLLGREISTLFNDVTDGGIHAVHLDASGFPSGIYFYTLHAGNFHQTKKMAVVK